MAQRTKKRLALGEQPREWLPVRKWLPTYKREWLKGDVTAGAVVAALAIPQSLGYATIAGLPVQIGLYSLPTVLVCYALLGTSRLLIVGPVSTVAVLTGSLIVGFNPANEAEAVAIAASMAIAAGLLLMVASVLKVGWAAEFLSKPIVTGFVFGLTILVIIGELPNILGIPVPPGDVLSRIQDLVTGLDEIHTQTFVVGVISLAIMFGGSRLSRRVPWALVTLILGLVLSNVLDLAGKGVKVVGTVPQGLPTPSIPELSVDQLSGILLAGGAIAFVGLAEGLSAARLFATKSGERIDANQDLLAFGAGNLSSGIFGGFGVAGSLSKTAAADRSGGRSQVTGLSTSVIAIVTILVFAPMLSALPKAVLSAIVIHAVWGLMDVKAMRRYAFLRINDIVAACVAGIGVLAFGPLQGLLLAIGLSVFGLVYRSSRVDVEVMGRVPGEKAAWGSMRNHPERHPVSGVLVLRVDVPLFWVNAASVKDAILARVDGVVQYVDEDIVAVIVDIEGTNQIDTTTVDMLDSLLTALRERGVDLYLVRVMYQVRIVLRHSGFVAKIGEDHMWHSISQGVREARIHYGLKEGVVDAAGGYDSSAEEHEERIIPTYFTDAKLAALAEMAPPAEGRAPVESEAEAEARRAAVEVAEAAEDAEEEAPTRATPAVEIAEARGTAAAAEMTEAQYEAESEEEIAAEIEAYADIEAEAAAAGRAPAADVEDEEAMEAEVEAYAEIEAEAEAEAARARVTRPEGEPGAPGPAASAGNS
ncbi:MAG: SulP family inorganic anion transporter [Propionicimonas sp.]